MRVKELLRQLDPLSAGDRIRRITAIGRELRGSGELGTLLDDLGRGAAYERGVGLHLAKVAGHVEYVTRMLRDPEPAVQSRALAAVASGVRVSDDELRILYDDAPAALRNKLIAVVRRTKRRHLATRLIDEHRHKWGDRAAVGLLPATDDATIERLLPELAYCLGPGDWERLAASHPLLVIDYAERTLPTTADRAEWWQGPGHAVVRALDHQPAQSPQQAARAAESADPTRVPDHAAGRRWADRVLALIQRAMPVDELPWPVIGILGRLIDLDPDGMFGLLVEPSRAAALPRALTSAVRHRLYRFSDEQLTRLGRLLWPDLTSLLADLPPARRAGIFAMVTADVDLSQTELPESLLDILPRTTRHEQARRMLTMPSIVAEPRRRWEVVAHLPYQEAAAELEPESRRPDPDDRALIHQALIGAAGRSRDPGELARALSWSADKVRNDRDSVRAAVLRAVLEIPAAVLHDDHVEALQRLCTDVLEARDSSYGTRWVLTEIAQQAVLQGAVNNRPALLAWGLSAHAQVTDRQGAIRLSGLVAGLPRGREAEVYEAFRPAIEAAAKRREYGLALSVAAGLGRRGWSIPHLHEILEQAVWSNQEYTVDLACRYWLEPRRTRAERVGRIIGREVRMARWNAVWEGVTQLRTDLLDEVLAKPDRIRRFDRDHPAWHVPSSALRRWLPRQQARYAELLVAAANDPKMTDWTRASAVSTLGRVPGAGRAALEQFLGSEEVLLQEAALGALAWTDRPDLALPVLLEHAGDDRARVAVYAASRAARYVQPSRLTRVLQPLLSADGVKVTSRKEAVRLLGELRAPGAGAVLTEAWATAHRDVRAAIVSTASQHLLYDPAGWAVLEQAVHDSAATAVVLTQRTAFGMPAAYRARYADLLIAVTPRAEPEAVGAALLALANWGRFNPAAARVCADFVTRLDIRGRVWRDAVTALVGIVTIEPADGLDELLTTVRLLVRLEEDPQLPNAEADRDHPARQRLALLVTGLCDRLSSRSAEVRQVLVRVADELTAADHLWLRVRLLVTALDDTELTRLLDVIAGQPLAALSAAELLTRRLTSDPRWTPDQLHPVASELMGSTELESGLLAHTLIAVAGPRSGWAAPWRDLLVALRNHPVPDVRRRALDLTTAAEV